MKKNKIKLGEITEKQFYEKHILILKDKIIKIRNFLGLTDKSPNDDLDLLGELLRLKGTPKEEKCRICAENYADMFFKGRDSVFYRNESGCSCIFDDNQIIKVCDAHKHLLEQALQAKGYAKQIGE
jgi:hypothetical protein